MFLGQKNLSLSFLSLLFFFFFSPFNCSLMWYLGTWFIGGWGIAGSHDLGGLF